MPRVSRKFVFDKALRKVVEITPDDIKVRCDEIEAGTNLFKQEIEPGLPKPHPPRRSLAKWPLHSEAMAVDVDDIGRAQDILRQHGVVTEYDRIGRPILRDRAHRKAHCAAMGFYDRDAGYGDQTPVNFQG